MFNMNIDDTPPSPPPKKMPNFNKILEFYKEVYSACTKIGGDPSKGPATCLRVRKQIVWDNKFIQLK